MTPYRLVLCTWPAEQSAEEIARDLVARGLAACVSLVPGLSSVYSWQGQVETAREQLLLIKTSESAYPALEHMLQSAHPYATPEIVTLVLDAGLPAYLEWLGQCVAGPKA
jgi:periplasmic divalent cation tolerance protein